MIASISQGGSFGGLFGYLLADEKKAKIIGGNVACRSVKGLTREFKAISDLNPQVTVIAKHIALAFAPEDGEIANSLKAEIAMKTKDYADWTSSGIELLIRWGGVSRYQFAGMQFSQAPS